MRAVVLAANPRSEYSAAVACELMRRRIDVVGVVSKPTVHWDTLQRKLSEWGVWGLARYAGRKLIPQGADEDLVNPRLSEYCRFRERTYGSIAELAESAPWTVQTVQDLNDRRAVDLVREWDADLLVYTGGGIVKKALLSAPKLGVLNVHAGPLPEIRGMSAQEWTLLLGLTPTITVHFMDNGIDTGPIVLRRELPGLLNALDLEGLRDAMQAEAVPALGDAVSGLEQGELTPVPQEEGVGRQYFVMHELLKRQAACRLRSRSTAADRARPQ